ncbi:hypothetical protein Tco_0608651 [Tanacetum coccineum]
MDSPSSKVGGYSGNCGGFRKRFHYPLENHRSLKSYMSEVVSSLDCFQTIVRMDNNSESRHNQCLDHKITTIHAQGWYKYTPMLPVLPLPENWCNDFCGFLMCVVVDDRVDLWSSPDITIKEEASDDMRGMFHDVVWGESFSGAWYVTWVWYVSFASLRCTEWWNPTHKNVSFRIHHYQTNPSSYLGIGASLVPMNNGSGLADTSTDSSEFTDDYTHKISISLDSKSSLTISPRVYL